MIKLIKTYDLAFYFILAVLFYFISLSLMEAYTEGDQIFYHLFYDRIQGLSLSEVGTVAKNTIDGAEPIFWLIMWIGSNIGFDKNSFISIINVILIISLIVLLRKHNSHPLVILFTVSNFYVIVLITGAERLKFAYLLIILSFITNGKKRILFIVFSILSHLQILLIALSYFCYMFGVNCLSVLTRFKLKRIDCLLSLSTFICTTIIAFIFQDALIHKFTHYSNGYHGDLDDLLKSFILLTITLIISLNKTRAFLMSAPLILLILVIGAERINMILFTVVFGVLMYERRLSHPLFLIILFYLSFKSLFFVRNVYNYGNGFTKMPF
jgi:hypothetical protein